jgi:hypothetical protein
MTNPDFYLASAEGYGLEEPHKGWKVRRLTTQNRDDFLLIRIDPPLVGQKYGLGGNDIDHVIVATRHKGDTLFPITKWPMYVHVARLLIDLPEEVSELKTADYESIAWAELYKTENDARNKAM